MASNITFGASIVPTKTDDNRLLPQPTTESPALTPAVSRDDFYNSNVPIQSPFYQHPPASHEVVSHSRQNSDNKVSTAVFEKDVESGNVTPLSGADDENPFTRDHGIENNKECAMWPSRKTLKQKKKEERKLKRDQRGCTSCAPVMNAWSKLTKKQRLLVKIAVALFLVGVAVAIGVGISVAVKGTYYVADGSSKHIGR
ncbi:hypothetical protein M409DRAFT_21045 [Zasmidium cellare ATCC 36951]|uniref:Uncharacterized protein n=1 Tax=Zasmidium cellare ATCC 36951 TaxID=1080233 RepID=A0A6A6CPK3_ZASCE|nr:uncharacterized protein M409DRAFT_21045 [Zasmidium cellare ATCC 36951]KAF2169035.1 hypothetical protein M409DRAFT_21045 [Zasmidium cellare ATCC 36951]